MDIKQFYQVQDSDFWHVKVAPSQMPIGEGLFASSDFATGDIIGQYRGPIIDSEYCNDDHYQHEDKMVYLNKNYCVLGRSAMCKANDIVKYEPEIFESKVYEEARKKKILPIHTQYFRNAQIDANKNKAFLVATRDIKAGEQIFTNYGYEYWEYFLKRDPRNPNHFANISEGSPT